MLQVLLGNTIRRAPLPTSKAALSHSYISRDSVSPSSRRCRTLAGYISAAGVQDTHLIHVAYLATLVEDIFQRPLAPRRAHATD